MMSKFKVFHESKDTEKNNDAHYVTSKMLEQKAPDPPPAQGDTDLTTLHGPTSLWEIQNPVKRLLQARQVQSQTRQSQ